MDKPVISPEELIQKKSEYDKIIIGSMRVIEIKSKLLELGLSEEEIVYPRWEV
jgi:hemerythrin superfamily protein